MKLSKRKYLGIVLCLSLLAASYSLFWVSNTELGTVKDSAAAASSGTGRTPEQRQLAQQAQAAVRNTPQSSVRPARLDLDELPDLASRIRLAETSMAESLADSVDRKRARQRELVDRVAEQYQLDSNQITIQANNEGEIRLLNFRQAIKTGDASGAALRLLSENPELFNLSSPETLTILRQSPTGSDGLGSILYGREFKGVKVNGNDVRVLVNPDGIKSVLGQFEYIDPTFDVSGSIPVTELERIASSIDGYERFTPDVTTAEPQIIFSEGLPSFVTSIKARDPWNRKIEAFIDPREKKVVKVEEYFYDVQVETNAEDLAGNTVDFYVEDAGPISYLINKTISSASGWTVPVRSYVEGSYDGTLERYQTQTVNSSRSSGPWEKSAVSAMSGLLKTFKYLNETHGLEGTGSPSKEVVVLTDLNFEGYRNNAFWSSDTIGLGKGGITNNFASSLDIMAHEIVHGVITYSSNLRYQNQSGALNESFADIFGAMVDRDDWTLGEDLNGQGIRSLQDPTGFGDPAHMDDFRKWPLSRDKGGVHTNSGIPNRAYYLLAEGLTLEGLGSSIGKDKAEKLAYSTMVNLTRDSDFQAAAALMLTSAEARYGEESPESLAVVAAWSNVGIFLDSSQEDDDSPVGTPKRTYLLDSGDDLLVALYPRDGYVYDARDDVFDLYAVKACSTRSCEGRAQESAVLYNVFSTVADTLVGPLNDVPVSRTIPSAARVAEGYTWIAYVGTDGNAYFSPVVNIDFEPLKFDMPDPIARVGLSRDYKRFVFVLENSKEIYVYSFDRESWVVYEVEGRSFSTTGAGEDVRRVDAVSFSVDSDQIVFDYEICRPSSDPDLDCDFVWSIGLLDLNTGFEYPFPPQPNDVDIGFPRLSSIGAERIVYQQWDYSIDGVVRGSIEEYDYFKRQEQTIWSTTLTGFKGYRFGWPDYFPQDWGVTFTNPNPMAVFKGYTDDFRLSKSYGVGDWWTTVDHIAGFVHRASYLNIYSEASVSSPTIDFGNVIKGNTATRTVTLENSGNQELEVTSVQASSGLEASLLNVRLAASGTETFSVKFDSGVVRRGKYTGSIDIGSTADRGSASVNVIAFVDIDTDGDGIGNAIDPDDDNDGVADYRDAYPLIALGGLSDLDNDGRPDDCDRQCQSLGMTADLDDDGDSMPDALELANGLNPLDADDCPSWYCLRLNRVLMVAASPGFDLDGDGLSRAQELALGTNFRLPDTDGDGLNDGTEVNTLGSNPLLADTDGDGLDDATEVGLSTSPLSPDTDGDSMPDGTEVSVGLNPNDDSDCPDWFCPRIPVSRILQ